MNLSIFKNFLYPPNYLRLPFASIEIGEREIRFVEIVNNGKDFTLTNFGEFPIEQNIFKEGEILNRAELIKKMLSVKGKLKSNFVKLSIPEEKTYVFSTYVPQLKDEEIRQAIEFKIEENVPLKAEEAVFEYKIIKKPKNKRDDLLVGVFVTSKKVIEEYNDILNESGLIPVSFDVESRAVAESVIPKKEIKTVLIVNIKDDKTILSVASNKMVWFTSTIALGNSEIEETLIKSGRITDKNSTRFSDYFLNEKNYDVDTYFSLLNVFSVIKDEVEKISAYWHEQKQKSDLALPNIEKIILCGKYYMLPGFVNHINQNLGLDVSLANIWCNAFDLDDFLPDMDFADSLSYSSVVGLSLIYDEK